MQMLLVYSLKNTISIGEIKRVLQNIYALPEYDAATLGDTYDRFLDVKAFARDNAWAFVEAFLNGAELDVEDEKDFFVVLLGLSCMSSYLKNAVQALLEAHYPDLTAEQEREEKERREELKRAKLEKKKAAKSEKSKKKSADGAVAAHDAAEELADAAAQ